MCSSASLALSFHEWLYQCPELLDCHTACVLGRSLFIPVYQDDMRHIAGVTEGLVFPVFGV